MKKVQKDNDSWFCYTVEFQNQGLITWPYHMALSHGIIQIVCLLRWSICQNDGNVF